MKAVSELHFRVIDKGLFLPIARRLARDAEHVSYWTPHEQAFPTVKSFVGDGFADIERVNSIWTDIDEVDCFVFPDVGFSDEQAQIKSIGIPVFGSGYGDRIEVNRGVFLDALEGAMLPIPNYQSVRGITKLKEYLNDKEDVWVKISRFRGDTETFHWRSFEDDENYLNVLAEKFGPYREHIVFYAFDAINTENEDGCDTWCIDGEYPKLVIHGMEAKDKAYLGTWQSFADLPRELRAVSTAFAPVLEAYNYRSFFSTEVRITESGESYFIDPTCRAGSPPSQVMTEMIGNYGEIIWGGANGKLIEPEPSAKFGVQAMITIAGDFKHWRSLKVDDELDRWVKTPNTMFIDGRLWFPPKERFDDMDIYWLVGIGDRPEEAIRHLQHNASLLPDGATCQFGDIADLIRKVNDAEENGMEFSDQPIPGPEIVLEQK